MHVRIVFREFAAHSSDAAEKMPMPGRCGHLLFGAGFLLRSRNLRGTTDGLGHVGIVHGMESSFVHKVVLKFL